MKQDAPRWLTPMTDYGPIVVFFIAYLSAGLMAATGALLVATLVALVVAYIVARHIPKMALFTAILVGIFGGLTLILQDETFIKMKPTVVQLLFALLLLGGLALGRSPLKFVMGKALHLDDVGWRALTFRFVGFFVVMAVLNELVWRTQSLDFWVTFKVFGLMGLTFLFIILQIPFLKRHAKLEEEAQSD